MANPKLKSLRTGDAFRYEGQVWIAISICPDPFDIFCLNTRTKKIERIDESERVELIEHWYVSELYKPEGKAVRGRRLEEL